MFHHVSVMLNETIDYLSIRGDGVYVNCTLGGAGHALYLLSQLNDRSKLTAIDQGLTAIENAKKVLKKHLHKITFVHNNFRELADTLNELEVEKVDGIYYDLGVSSPQLDVPEGGSSYHNDAKLDMRMDQTQSLSAHKVVNQWSYEALVKIFFRCNEEKSSKQVARRIEAHREQQPIKATLELTNVIKKGIPAKTGRKGKHPAKCVFQAIRIAMNGESSASEDSVKQAIECVKVRGRTSVTTLRSLGGRLCKRISQEFEKGPDAPRSLPVVLGACTSKLERVNRKPITATDDNLNDNSRTCSAKLRVAEILK